MDVSATRVKSKPGRKAETPAQRLARLESDLAAARQAVRDAEYRKAAVVGTAVLAEAEQDHEFRERLHTVLRARVTKKEAKADFAGLFVEPRNAP